MNSKKRMIAILLAATLALTLLTACSKDGDTPTGDNSIPGTSVPVWNQEIPFQPETYLKYYLDDYLEHMKNLEQTPGLEAEELAEMLKIIQLHYTSLEQTFADTIANPYIERSPESYFDCRVCEAQTICQCELCGGDGAAWQGQYGKYKNGAPCDDTGSGLCHACDGLGVEPNPEYIKYMAGLLARSSKTGEMMFQFNPDDFGGDSPAEFHGRNYPYLTLYKCIFCDENGVTLNGDNFCIICAGLKITFRIFHEPVTPAELALMIEEEEVERLRNEEEWRREQENVEKYLLEWEEAERLRQEEYERQIEEIQREHEQWLREFEEEKERWWREWEEHKEQIRQRDLEYQEYWAQEKKERLRRQVAETNLHIQQMSLARQADLRNAEYAAMNAALSIRPATSWDILAGTYGGGGSSGTGSGGSSSSSYSDSGSGLSQRLCSVNDCWSYAASSTTSYCHGHKNSVSFQKDCAALGCSVPPMDGSRYCAAHQ